MLYGKKKNHQTTENTLLAGMNVHQLVLPRKSTSTVTIRSKNKTNQLEKESSLYLTSISINIFCHPRRIEFFCVEILIIHTIHGTATSAFVYNMD